MKKHLFTALYSNGIQCIVVHDTDENKYIITEEGDSDLLVFASLEEVHKHLSEYAKAPFEIEEYAENETTQIKSGLSESQLGKLAKTSINTEKKLTPAIVECEDGVYSHVFLDASLYDVMVWRDWILQDKEVKSVTIY